MIAAIEAAGPDAPAPIVASTQIDDATATADSAKASAQTELTDAQKIAEEYQAKADGAVHTARSRASACTDPAIVVPTAPELTVPPLPEVPTIPN